MSLVSAIHLQGGFATFQTETLDKAPSASPSRHLRKNIEVRP